jgi:nicotinate-nucleotide adenylyltransferase
MRGLPLAYPGMRIGLFGGSFDPAHGGHAHVAEVALARLGLDRVWWLVTPQNPLKPQSSPLEKRVQSARKIARGGKMVVTDFEARLQCRFTYQTLRVLKRLYPGVEFILVMGGDNLANIKRWKNWREVARSVEVAVVSRPDAGVRARAAMPQGWIYLRARENPQSSGALRARQGAVAEPRRK